MQNYYQTLGLTPAASTEEIKKAYRLYASKFHPDKNQGDMFFEERFKEIQKAYQVLSDERAKAQHDNLLKVYQSNQQVYHYKFNDLEAREALLKKKEYLWKEKENAMARNIAQRILKKYYLILLVAFASNIFLLFGWLWEQNRQAEAPFPYQTDIFEKNRAEQNLEPKNTAPPKESFKVDSLTTTLTAEQLQLWWNNLDKDWKDIFKTAIYLIEEPQMPDLYKMANLQRLECDNKQLKDLKPLVMLSKLRILHCSGNPLRNLNDLKNNANLEELWCYNTFIENLEPLKNLKKLKRLSFNNTPIADLQPLENLPNLQIINCSKTLITTLYPLQNLPNLRFVGCYENNISITELRDFEIKNHICKIMY